MPVDEVYREIYAAYPGVPLVFGDGNKQARLLLIGEAPGQDEISFQRPFVGRAGQNLKEFLGVLELDRSEIYITNVCKFRPFKVSAKNTVSNRPPTKKEVMDSLEFLYREIGEIGPRVIVTLGNTPLRAVKNDFTANIGEHHGRPQSVEVSGREYILFALYHPASILYNTALKEVYQSDLDALSLFLKERGLK